MIKPNYKNGSVVNLMSSIGRIYGYKSIYNPIKEHIPKNKTVIFILIDGLGYEFIKQFPDSEIYKHTIRSLTSVFPSATGAAMPSILSGIAPKNHGMLGWFTYLKEYGFQIADLPYVIRGFGIPMQEFAPMKEIYNLPSFFDKISVPAYFINPKRICNSEFSKLSGGKAKRLSYSNLSGFFKVLKKTASSNRQKFIFGYYPDFDAICHDFSPSSKKAKDLFWKIDRQFRNFISSVKDSTVILTADHGHIDTPIKKGIVLSKYPKIKNMLSMPLSGEYRMAYCFVKPEYYKVFPKILRENLGRYLDVYSSSTLIKKNVFGIGKLHPSLDDRTGDYTIIMKDDYTIYDSLGHEKKPNFKGLHGGLTKGELLVPLVIYDTNTNNKKK